MLLSVHDPLRSLCDLVSRLSPRDGGTSLAHAMVSALAETAGEGRADMVSAVVSELGLVVHRLAAHSAGRHADRDRAVMLRRAVVALVSALDDLESAQGEVMEARDAS
mgnify:CR=1 FL=1